MSFDYRAPRNVDCENEDGAGGNEKEGRSRPSVHQNSFRVNSNSRDARPARRSYPRTLILENDSTARPHVGRPIDMAGRKVVKISMRFTSGSTSLLSLESERIR